MSKLAVAVVLISLLPLLACKEKNASKANSDIGGKAPIDVAGMLYVSGTCKEDHANKGAEYSGALYLIKDLDTKREGITGDILQPFDLARFADEAKHPTEYQPPFKISFTLRNFPEPPDVFQIHGVSDSKSEGEREQPLEQRGYATTCDLRVLERGHSLSDMPRLKAHFDSLRAVKPQK